MILAISMRIGIRNSGREVYYLLKEYQDIFQKLGVLLYPVLPGQDVEKIAHLCDGVILTGAPSNNGKEKEADDLDYNLIREFYQLKKPILGICRGMQMLNCFFGGTITLVEKHDFTEDIERHRIDLKPCTFVHEYFDQAFTYVNSMHRFQIQELAKKFISSSTSQEGVIESIECDNMIGVQWHPEVMKDSNFFRHFVQKYITKK